MTANPPKFTPFKEGDKKKHTPKKSGKKTGKKKPKKKGSTSSNADSSSSTSMGSLPTQDGNSDFDTLMKEKDEEIAALKKKVRKYENELRRSDDTILVQEEEINRLKKKLKDFEGGAGSQSQGSEISDGGEGGKKKRSKKPKTSKASANSVNINTVYPLMHMNLREGVQKDCFSDLSFTVTAPTSSGSGTVSAHSAIISVRCPLFDKRIKDKYGSKKKKKQRKKELDIKGSQVITINRMLDFLYEDNLPYLAKLKPLSLLHLIIAARAHKLNRLVWICENQLLDILCLDNVVPLLKGAHALKDNRIRKFCMDYLLLPDSFKEFVLRKDLTTELGMDLFQELVTLNATAAATGGTAGNGKKGGHAVVDLGDCPPSEIRDHMKGLFKTMIYADAAVRIETENIVFHKAVLAAASKPLFDCLTRARLNAGVMEDVSDCLDLAKDQKFFDKLSADAFKGLLKFVYYGDTSIEALPACLLIPFVREFGMKNLQELCEKVIQQSVTDSHVVLKIMAVTYLAIMRAREDMRDKLRKECIQHIVTHLREVDFLEIKNMDSEYSLDLAVDLLLACQKQYQ